MDLYKKDNVDDKVECLISNYIDRLINDYNNRKGNYKAFIGARKELVTSLERNVHLFSYHLETLQNKHPDRVFIMRDMEFGLSNSMKILQKTSNKFYFPYMGKIDKMLPEYAKLITDDKSLEVQLDLCEIACNALTRLGNKSTSSELSEAFNIVANIVNNACKTVRHNSDVERLNEYVECVNNVYSAIRKDIGDCHKTISTADKPHVEGEVAKLNPDILIRIGVYEEQNKPASKDNDNVDQM